MNQGRILVADESDPRWKEIAIHNDEKISGFFGDYSQLSNFWEPAPVFYEGVIYPTAENAYQAAKFHRKDRQIFESCSPAKAKELSKIMGRLFSEEEWKARKLQIMELILRQKFSSRNPELQQFLIDTGDRELIEANWWGDEFWGVYIPNPMAIPRGENHLGKLLMKIRKELQMARK
jgi:ribA/ribD-fused uncharacterized protein